MNWGRRVSRDTMTRPKASGWRCGWGGVIFFLGELCCFCCCATSTETGWWEQRLLGWPFRFGCLGCVVVNFVHFAVCHSMVPCQRTMEFMSFWAFVDGRFGARWRFRCL